MKKILLMLAVCFLGIAGYAQTSVSRYTPVIVGTSPFQDSMWTTRFSDYNVILRLGPSLPGFTITGINALAKHPTTGEVYCVMKVSGVSGRVLGKINMRTGVCSSIGNLGSNFATLAFNANGTLFGVTGQSATPPATPETMYRISTTDASRTLFRGLGDGADGETIIYNTDDNKFYHWSGNGTVVWQRFDTSGVDVIETLSYSGTPGGETFGAMYLGSNQILTSNISAHFKIWTVSGASATIGADLSNNPDDIRGMVTDSCKTTISTTSSNTPATLSVTGASGNYQWYMNGSAISGATNSTYAASLPGVYNCIYEDFGGVTDSTATGLVLTTSCTPPAAITGSSTVCVSGASTLASATSGGTWSSSNTAIATVGSSTGVVTGVGTGIVNISYTVSGCSQVKSVTVNPAMASISVSTPYVCLGTTGTFTHPVAGGTWSSAVPFCASIDATTGVVTGVHVGVTNITYTAGTGCVKTTTVQVMNITMNITGSSAVCPATTSTLSNPTSGGLWTVDSTSIATINSSTGVLTGVAPGNANITYTVGECRTYRVATVNTLPDTIVAAASAVCVGGTINMSCATGGGAWSSSNTAKATVGTSSGVVTAVSAGTATISYAIGSGCYRTKTVTVGAMPAAITGTMAMCQGGSVTLSSSTSGGTWSSSAAGTASVVSSAGTTAVISGVSAGTADISYNHSGGCVRTATVTVNGAVGSNTGTATICVGGTTTLSNPTGGGTWSSSVTAKATVGSLSGIVTGVAVGTSNITYRTSATCFAVTQVTVSTTSAISGSAAACVGLTTTLTHGIGGGTWSSSNSSIATVDATTGVVTGVAAGAVNITYLVSPGCFAVKSMMVYNVPTISGTLTVCEGSVRTLTKGGGTGTWSTSDSAIATVHPTMGQVTGVSAGVVTITYRVTATGCYTTCSVTVNPTPAAIGGTTPICTGSSTTYTNSMSGGAWNSTNTTVMTIDSVTGNANAIAGGYTLIRYTIPATGCTAGMYVTVSAVSAISGTASVCEGASTTLSHSTGGGTWTASNTNATIDTATGVVTGVTAGSTTITYTISDVCFKTIALTIKAAPAAIAGAGTVCAGASTTLTNATTGGTWSSSATGVATVGSGTGIVNGVTAGMATISYRVTATGCYATTAIMVGGLPDAGVITGASSVCQGSAITLADTVGGGVWSSSDTAKATVSGSGVVTGVAAGSVMISYVVTNSCGSTTATQAVTVNAIPDAGTISGASSVVVGATTTLSNTVTGGTWSSSNTGLATVGSGDGVVTGVAPGAVIISYNMSCGATATFAMTVVPAVSACTPIYSVADGSCTLYATYIKDFTLGGSGGTSIFDTGTSCDGTGYQNRVGIAAVPLLMQGGTFSTYILTGPVNPMKAQVWIDFNNDGVYAPEEAVGGTTSTFVDGVTFNINVSGSAAIGTHGMRVRVGYNTTTPTYPDMPSCDDLTYGEGHDYRVTIISGASRPAAISGGSVELSSVSVVPNPTKGRFTINTTVAGELVIYTLDGRQVQQATLNAGATSLDLQSSLAAGVYVCRFNGVDGSIQTVRLVFEQ